MTNLFVVKKHPTADLPKRATTESAGLDVTACLYEPSVTFFIGDTRIERAIEHGVVNIWPRERVMIPTGLRMSVDAGYCIKFYPRSGNALKRGLTLINCVGIGDRDYGDEYWATIVNNDNKVQSIANGERICQLMVERVEPVELVECDELPTIESNRNGGLGSTGK